MRFQSELVAGRLLGRYKRFFADVELATGERVTAHCANTGRMTGLDTPGLPVYLSVSDNPKRKLKYSLELVELPTGPVGINTAHPNRITAEALAAGRLSELAGYGSCRPEVAYGEGSRVDFLLGGGDGPSCYLEVKNAHLCREPGVAEFPDAATARGVRHLNELAAMVKAGHRAALLYLVQRTDCGRFRLAGDIDPAYALATSRARQIGVQFLAYRCRIDLRSIELADALPIIDGGG